MGEMGKTFNSNSLWLFIAALFFSFSSMLVNADAPAAKSTTSLAASEASPAKRYPIVTHKIEGKYHEVLNNIRSAIIGKGIHIAHVLPASGMLNRTGAAFGYKENVYLNAQTLEFCSADISHKLARQDPENIILCPFTVSVYNLVKDPGVVRLTYRVPVGKPGSEKVTDEIVALIESIIEDAEW